MKRLLVTIPIAISMFFLGYSVKSDISKSYKLQKQFDTCIVLGHEAANIAREAQRQRDSVIALLGVYKTAFKYYNPSITISDPGTFAEKEE